MVMIVSIDVWQRLAMDFLKFHPGLPCSTLLNPISGVAHLQGRRPAAVLYHFGHSMLYAYEIW
jgi:hypothetical protein